jgi:UTP-glucose-1-phosphate uridylyltransferase
MTTHWSTEPGFINLSEGAQKIALFADKNKGSIAGIFKKSPELINDLDEFHQWSAHTIRAISGKKRITETTHPIKRNLRKK